MSELDFNTLFDAVVRDWPAKVEAKVVHIEGADGKARYIVEGLGELEEALMARHLDSAKVVLIEGVHAAIYIRLHALAPDVRWLVASELNRPVVRAIFEQRLREAERSSTLGWTDADRALVRDYFTANAAPTASAA